jgi:hypothetical protein
VEHASVQLGPALSDALQRFEQFLLSDDGECTETVMAADRETLRPLAETVNPLFDEINAVLDREPVS